VGGGFFDALPQFGPLARLLGGRRLAHLGNATHRDPECVNGEIEGPSELSQVSCPAVVGVRRVTMSATFLIAARSVAVEAARAGCAGATGAAVSSPDAATIAVAAAASAESREPRVPPVPSPPSY
jgi:hypothetical protein